MPAATPEDLPTKPNSEPPVVDGGLIAAIARIELEISSLDKQRRALNFGGRDLETTFGRHAGIVPRLCGTPTPTQYLHGKADLAT